MSVGFRLTIALLTSMLANAGLLMVSYPIWREFRYQRYSVDFWMQVYIGAAILIGLLAAALAAVIYCFNRQQSKRRLATFQAAIMFVILSVVATVSGTDSPYALIHWPHVIQAMDAKFFSEVKFLTFIFYDAIPMSIISGLLFAFVLGGRRAPYPR